MTRHCTTAAYLLRIAAAILLASIASLIAQPPAPALALHSGGSLANIPFSAVSPGGVDMATGH